MGKRKSNYEILSDAHRQRFISENRNDLILFLVFMIVITIFFIVLILMYFGNFEFKNMLSCIKIEDYDPNCM
jgi:hypothetical protein